MKRRQFLKGLAGVGSAVVLAGCGDEFEDLKYCLHSRRIPKPDDRIVTAPQFEEFEPRTRNILRGAIKTGQATSNDRTRNELLEITHFRLEGTYYVHYRRLKGHIQKYADQSWIWQPAGVEEPAPDVERPEGLAPEDEVESDMPLYFHYTTRLTTDPDAFVRDEIPKLDDLTLSESQRNTIRQALDGSYGVGMSTSEKSQTFEQLLWYGHGDENYLRAHGEVYRLVWNRIREDSSCKEFADSARES